MLSSKRSSATDLTYEEAEQKVREDKRMTEPASSARTEQKAPLSGSSFHEIVTTRFGVLPNFFCSASAAPGLIEELWAFAKSAYLDSPLPSLFKERLFVHLSRFCEVRYCIVRHVGFLIGEGRPAGDPDAVPETVEQVLELLRRPVPDAAGLGAAIDRLEGLAGPMPIPDARTRAEGDLFDVLAVIFLEPRRSARALQAVRHAIGLPTFEFLAAFLGFVRTAHYWTETHPELAYEADMLACMEQHPELGRLLLDSTALRRALETDAVTQRNRAEAALRQNKIWLAAQKEAFQSAMDGASLQTSLGVLVDAVVERTEGDRRCAFYIADANGAALRHVVGMPEGYARRVDGFEISPESLACGLAVATGEPVITPDVLEEPRWQPWTWLAREYGYRGCWSFPIETSTGKLLGSLAMYFTEPREPTAGDRELAAALGQTAAIIISRRQETEDRTRIHGELVQSQQDQAAELAAAERLQSVSTELASGHNIQSLYDKIIDAAMFIMRADFASMQVVSAEHGAGQKLHLLAFRGFSPEAAKFWKSVQTGSCCSCGLALRTGRRVVVEDVATSEIMAGSDDLKVYLQTGIHAVQSTPLVSRGGELLGMISTHWRYPHQPAERDLRLVDILARQAADLIERAGAETALRESEERFRQFGEASSDILWVRDAQALQWEYLSPAFETIYGIARAEILKGNNLEHWAELIEPEDRERAIANLDRVRDGERITHEFRIRRADGEIRWIRNTDFALFDADGRVQRIGGIGQDVSDEKAIADRMEVMLAELQHRTRNLIAVVRSIAGQTMAVSGPTETFREEFNHRLDALARVQGLLSRADQEPITIQSLVRMELDALGATEMPERIHLDGPPVRIRHSAVQTLALALHELATNARKYGALSAEQGRLQVSWRTYVDKQADRLKLEWREAGGNGNHEKANGRGGYGRELIERALPYSLNAKTSFDLDDRGLRCTIDMPLNRGESRTRGS